jgi:hypothetical protein
MPDEPPPWAQYLEAHDAAELEGGPFLPPAKVIDAASTDASATPGDCPDGCGWTYPAGSKNRKRDLGAHRKAKHGVTGQSAWAGGQRRGRKVPKDQAPPSVRVDIRTGPSGAKGKGDPQLDAVERRAVQVANFVAMALFMAQQQADAADVKRGADTWAESVRALAVHEDWLRNLLGSEGGDASERFLAWLQFAVATGGLLLPILIRHGAIPEAMLAFLSMADLPTPPAAAPPGEPGERVAA